MAENDLSLKEQLLILDFWAHGMDIRQEFGPEKLRAIPGLEEVILAVSKLPAQIGWGDEPDEGSDEALGA